MKKQKNNISLRFTQFFKQAYPLITTAIIALTLSPLSTQTAYDPNYVEPTQVSDAAKKTATEKLLRAAETGDAKRAHEAILEHADINADTGSPALIRASRKGHIEVVQLLLEHNAPINSKDICGDTALIVASRYGHVEVACLLLQHNANTNIQNKKNDTALIQASRHGHTKIVYALLEHNTSIDIQNDCGDTALLESIRFHCPAIVETLILHGANITVKNYLKETALNIATPLVQKSIIHTIKKRLTFANELEQQNWDSEISSPCYILTQSVISTIASLICAYADPYNDAIEQPVLRAMKHYIRTNTAHTGKPQPRFTYSLCCAETPECSCAIKIKKIKTHKACAIQ